MQSLIKTCALPVMILSLTACGGGGGGGSTPSPSSAAVSSVAPSSATASSEALSSTAVSSVAASSIAAGNESTQTAVIYPGYTTTTNENYPSYSIAKIDNCGHEISKEDKTFAIFADYDSGVQNQSLTSLTITGWNHSNNENKNLPEWATLKVSNHATYDFVTSAKMNDSCNGVDTLNMVLVKKIADWEFQHSNGFERNILAHGYKFGDIEKLVIDIKVNSANTRIPSVANLKTTYISYVSAAAIDALDQGKVNVDITLHDGANLFGKINVQLDQETLADQWVRVTVPMNDVYFYHEINYNRTPKTLAELSNVVIQRMVVVGETRNGTVLRGPIGDTKWKTGVPETFKEADLSFKKIELQLKQ